MEKPKNLFLTEQDALALLSAWSVGTSTVQRINQGTVNTTFFVETPAGKFVLKLYNNSITTAQIEYEHSLLTHLQSCDLSFAVPTPVPTSSGETLALVNQNDLLLRFSLQHFISGQPAERKNLAHTHAVSQALGELHYALASFNSEKQIAQLPAWGDLYHIHPLITDPLEVPQLLKLNAMQQQSIIKMLTEVVEAAPRLYETLPVQVTHADYLCPNVLVAENRVVGVLDFEFATSDLRLIDYIAALDHFCRFPWKEVPLWEFVQAFSAGYAQHISFTQLELEALTLVWRLQRASCIVYWTGWFLEGKVTHQSVVDAVTNTLLLEDWLKENIANLLSYVSPT